MEDKIIDYIKSSGEHQKILSELRRIIQTTELIETIKWNQPTYTLKNKNVLSICSFKKGAGIWFFQGALLKDKLGVITNAQEAKTHAMRRWIFSDISELDPSSILSYIYEAIANEKAGKRVKTKRSAVVVTIPDELLEALDNDASAQTAYDSLSPSKRKEYAQHISSAKRAQTKLSRLSKILPMIKSGKGLNDKYLKK